MASSSLQAVLVLALVCLAHSAEVQKVSLPDQDIDAKPEVPKVSLPDQDIDQPFLVIAYAATHTPPKDSTERHFSPDDVVPVVEDLRQAYKVTFKNIIVLTKEKVDPGVLLQGAMFPSQFYEQMSICDLMFVMTGDNTHLPHKAVVPKGAKRVYLWVAGHGAQGDVKADGSQPHDYLTDGGVADFAWKGVAKKCPDTYRPGVAVREVEKVYPAFTARHVTWIRQQLLQSTQLFVFIESCFSASFFNKVVARIDNPEKLKSGKGRTQARRDELFKAELQLPNTLIVTGSRDYEPLVGLGFFEQLRAAVNKARKTHSQTWDDVINAMRAQQKLPANALTPNDVTALKATHYYRVRAFGDPAMLKEKVSMKASTLADEDV